MTSAGSAQLARHRAGEIAAWLRARLPEGAALRADSRQVVRGDAFFAWPGHSGDGRAYIGAACERGAAAILVDGPLSAPVSATVAAPAGLAAPAPALMTVDGLRDLAGLIAGCFYGEPAERVSLVAVTGTNGKTSCSQWIAQGLTFEGRRCAVVGTLGSGVLAQDGSVALEPFGLTMPDALSLHRMLARFVASGAEVVVMEASSIGLDQQRLSGARPSVALFTNLSRDHLDYHGTEEAYAQAKMRLFAMPGLGAAVLNADDPFSARALAQLDPACAAIVYGETVHRLEHPGLRRLRCKRVEQRHNGLVIWVDGDFGEAQIELPLIGRFNAMNALGVAAVWLALGMPFERVVQNLSALRPVPGRLQRVEPVELQARVRSEGQGDSVADGSPGAGSQAPLAIVDYAHTPDALAKVLEALRPLAQARSGALWCVFGAGGERDAGKRPLMAEVAERGADHVVITSDNPRSEDPAQIAAAVCAGLSRPAARVELDRARAIEAALLGADPRDVVLIAGKGHECWQEFASGRVPFSDVEEAARVLARIQGAAHV